MFRLLFRCVLLLGLAAVVAGGWLLWRSDDPIYQAQEWLYYQRVHRHDALIAEVSAAAGLDPLLVRAVIWRESKFDDHMAGKNGERGLMQVTENAAHDWARVEHRQFQPADLYQPRVNLEVGTWYLRKALERWKSRDDPVPFALAEYNAGKSRVDRWIEASGMGDRATGADLRTNIKFPSTRDYVETIEERFAFYQRRARPTSRPRRSPAATP